MHALTPSAVGTLHELKHIVELAAFACEARRILQEMTFATGYSPAFSEAVSTHVTGHNAWTTYCDSSAAVLDGVAERIGDLINEVQP
jgi:hypothetical protein